MATILDLKGTLAKMPMLKGRRPESTEAERQASGAFRTLAPYRDGNVYGAKFSGDAAWERHPNGDELVQIVDGSCTVHLMTDNGLETHEHRLRSERTMGWPNLGGLRCSWVPGSRLH